MSHIRALNWPFGAGLALGIGGPRWFCTPGQGVGLPVCGEGQLLRRLSDGRVAGAILVAGVVSVTSAIGRTTLPWGGLPVGAYWIFSCLAVRSLDPHATGVIDWLQRDARLQPSPNAGYPERELAGALGVELRAPPLLWSACSNAVSGRSNGRIVLDRFLGVRCLMYDVAALSYRLAGLCLL